MNMKQGVAQIAAFTALSAVMQLSRADDYISPTDERVRISLGAMHVSSATTIQSDSSAGVAGSAIDGERQFGLDRSNFEPKFQVMFRVDTRQRLSLDYFTLDRSGNAAVTGDPLVFRNVVFVPGDPLQAQLSLRTLGLTYGYSFWHSETLEAAATLGVHATDISIEAKVETQTRHIIQTQDEAGPVPTVGLDATWVASKRFYVDGRVQYLNVHVQDVSGSLGIYELDGLYRYRANVAFAVGYTDIQAHLASTKASNGGLFNLATRGPELFFRISF